MYFRDFLKRLACTNNTIKTKKRCPEGDIIAENSHQEEERKSKQTETDGTQASNQTKTKQLAIFSQQGDQSARLDPLNTTTRQQKWQNTNGQ